MTAASAAPDRWRHLPIAWAVLLPLVVLGPALGPGFVLTYDMVWVPDLTLRSDMLGFSPALPRAVPSDAVVAVLDEVVAGMVLQKLVLLGSLVLAGLGIARLVGTSVPARLVAVSVYVWNPFVAERLWIGHWPLLLGYAVLPWIAVAATRYRLGTGSWAVLALWLPWGSLSPNAGVMSAVMMLACGLTWRGWRARRRANLLLLLMAVAANAPWLVAGLLHTATATTADAAVFALHGEGPLPAVLAALTLGGIWNTEVVPASRDGLMVWVSLAGLAGLAGWGARTWWSRARGGAGVPLLACWSLGMGLALLPAALPGLVNALAGALPGVGLVRDSSRFLALSAPLLAVLVGTGAEVLLGRVRQVGPRIVLAGGLVLFPVMVMPDLAWGLGGALQPAHYPASYPAARAALAEADGARGGDVVILPFTSYRAPEWNGGRKVLAPLGRVLTPNDVTSDELSVSGRVLAGEDPRGPQVRAALALDTAAERSAALTDLGIQYASIEAGDRTLVAGRTVFEAPDLRIVELAGVADPRSPTPADTAWMTTAWAVWIGMLLCGAVELLRSRRRARRGDRRTNAPPGAPE